MLLAIDSGINSGWVLLRTGVRPAPVLVAAGTARTKLDPELPLQNWADRTADVLRSLSLQVRSYRQAIKIVAIEFPEFTKGESNKLCFMAGRTAGWAAEHFSGNNCKVLLIGVNEWKGQLPKAVSSERVLSRVDSGFVTVPPTAAGFVSGHTVDALGVGLYCVGVKIFT